MSVPELVLVDYGCGNLFSVQRRLQQVGVEPMISNEPDTISIAQKLILPGVGHFATAMANLRERELLGPLNHCALSRRIPILGICLGMQLMAQNSQEGNCEGLGWINHPVVALSTRSPVHCKIPHTGWNQVYCPRPSRLFNGIEDGEEFYFVHSFCLDARGSSEVTGETDYGQVFASAIEKENLFGVQFHPEKSHDAGETLLRNFVEI